MSMAELNELEVVKALITRGQQVGVLTYHEIATATAELDCPSAVRQRGAPRAVCPYGLTHAGPSRR